jgi:hypothetical protein
MYKQRRYDFTETITVCAGEEEKEYLIHKSVIITSTSKFMNKVLSNGWKEAHEQQIRLPETQATTLEVYLHWTHTGHLLVESTQTESVSMQCVKLYLLGDYVSDTVFCEAVVENMVDRGQERRLPCAAAITLVWDDTPENSPLRAVIKELWLDQKIAIVVKCLKERSFPSAFVLDLLEGLVSNNQFFCEQTSSGKSGEEVRKSCIGYVKTLHPEQKT